MRWRVEPLPDDGPLFNGAIDVYSEAFALPPYSDPDRGEEILYRLRQLHRKRPGYCGLIALSDSNEQRVPHHGVIGMTYGYCSQPGQWWHDAISRKLSQLQVEHWLSHAYELVEIAVHPNWQSQGIGALLVRELLANRPEETCVLSTRADSRAHELYDRLGFEVVTQMTFSPGGAAFYIMAKPLVIGG